MATIATSGFEVFAFETAALLFDFGFAAVLDLDFTIFFVSLAIVASVLALIKPNEELGATQ